MTPEQIKRRDELAELDVFLCWDKSTGDRGGRMYYTAFCSGYDAGLSEAQVLVSALEMLIQLSDIPGLYGIIETKNIVDEARKALAKFRGEK